MKKSIYLINPRSDFPTYYGGEILEAMGYAPGVLVADLVIPTVAAFVPEDFSVQLCDESISPIDFDINVDYVGITGKVSQKSRMMEIAHEFRKRGKIVVMGGSYVSLSPEVMRDHCDILVRGEIEDIADKLFGDLRIGKYQKEYIGTKPDLALSPIPRWDLYQNHRAAVGCIQTSRGCPYQCEFCDVIVYLGRNQRHKPVDKVIAELELLYSLGYRTVFLSDDNFTVNRKHAKTLLRALSSWNKAHKDSPVKFRTQVSTDVVKDDELMQLCAEAGLDQVFIGIESPNPDSMREVKKFQNVKVEMVEVIKKFYQYGIFPQCGMMVGFDADDNDIFRRQFELAMDSFSPFFTLSILVAPDATPLYSRLKNEGRIILEIDTEPGSLQASNIIGNNISKDDMSQGVQWLCSKLYAPQNFANRFLNMIDLLDRSSHPVGAADFLYAEENHIYKDMAALVMKIKKMGEPEKKMWLEIGEKIADKGVGQELFVTLMFFYAQLRHVYEKGGVWKPVLGSNESPWSEITEVEVHGNFL
jgi:radical SAM superfamily enzyme YgiQ (UPF0313 family)